MKLLAIPIFFTVLVLFIGFCLAWIIPCKKTKKWQHWDTVFTLTLLSAVIVPAWLLYVSPQWQVALFWSVTVLAGTYFAPSNTGWSYPPILNKSLQYTIGCVSIGIAWMSLMMLYVHRHW